MGHWLSSQEHGKELFVSQKGLLRYPLLYFPKIFI